MQRNGAGDGYIVLATGAAPYVEMATNLAASLRVMDPGRRVCLVHDEGAALPEETRRLFTDFAPLARDDRYPPVMNKLRLFGLTPYARTMYVDADCLLVKRDVDRQWARAASRPFSITGDMATTGVWHGVRIEEVLRQEGAPYLVRMNAGVFQFDDSPEAAAFFAGLDRYYLDRRDHLNISLYRGQRTQTDELYLGLWMGLNGMDAANMANQGRDSWMVSTWRALWCDFRPEQGRSLILKGDRHLLGVPVLPRRVVPLSPTFAHFIGLKPRRLYARLARRFRDIALERRPVA
jgi:hypothetical protein